MGPGRARDHLCHVALGGTLDVFWAGNRKQQSLRGQELFNATAQQWPVFLHGGGKWRPRLRAVIWRTLPAMRSPRTRRKVK